MKVEVMLIWRLTDLQDCLSFLFYFFALRDHLTYCLEFYSKMICTIKKKTTNKKQKKKKIT